MSAGTRPSLAVGRRVWSAESRFPDGGVASTNYRYTMILPENFIALSLLSGHLSIISALAPGSNTREALFISLDLFAARTIGQSGNSKSGVTVSAYHFDHAVHYQWFDNLLPTARR